MPRLTPKRLDIIAKRRIACQRLELRLNAQTEDGSAQFSFISQVMYRMQPEC